MTGAFTQQQLIYKAIILTMDAHQFVYGLISTMA